MPEYSIRESKRAKHVSLHMSARDGLVLVAPHGFDHSQIPNILKRKQSWIENAYRRIEQQGNTIKPKPVDSLPERIFLQAVNEEFLLEYKPLATHWVEAAENGNNTILVSGAINKHTLCKTVLQKWVNYKAKKYLIPWLKKVSEEIDLPFSRSTIRNQRLRWGSCSKQKNISINQKLLFFPEHLVRYIFIHELCHTVHLNHSVAFWAFVGQKEPNFKQLRKETRTAWKYIPDWSND